MRGAWRVGFFLWFCACWVGAIPLDQVENPRQRDHTWITDQARLMQPATVSRLNQAIDQLESSQGCELAVVTIQDTDGQTPKAFATQLFNRWGIGKQGQNNGVLFLVVVQRHRCEVEVGDGMRARLPDATCTQLLQAEVVPRFKAKQFDQGVEAGVRAVLARLSIPQQQQAVAAPPAAPPRPRATPVEPAVSSGPLQVVDGWLRAFGVISCIIAPLSIGLVLVLTAVFSVFGRPFASGGLLTGLGFLLLAGIVLVSTGVYGALPFGLTVLLWWLVTNRPRICPRCSNKTWKVTSTRTVEPASYSSSGRGVRDCRCSRCGHSGLESFTIAMLVESSSDSNYSSDSSSSPDFGGGSSSGGGGGADW